jgi:hypothetical protein
LNAQTNDLSELASLEENEQITIDIKIGGCFGARTDAKILIIKFGEKYEFICVDSVSRTLAKIDKKLVLYPERQKKWLAENLDTLKKYGKKSVLTAEQYQSKITLLQDIIKANDNCKSRMYGEYSIIKINSKRLQYKKSFGCSIILLNFADN